MATTKTTAARRAVLRMRGDRSIAERLKRGAIPVEEALEVARQIADGLEEAALRDGFGRNQRAARHPLAEPLRG